MMIVDALWVLGLLGLVDAHPTHPAGPNANPLSKRGIDLDAYRMPELSEYVPTEEIPNTPAASVSINKRGDYVETATELVKSVFPEATFRVVEDHYTGTNGVSHIRFKQTINGLDVDNGDFNVNVSTPETESEKRKKWD